MRILPIALVDPPDDAAELIDRAHRSSAITHGAPECLAACAVYVLDRQAPGRWRARPPVRPGRRVRGGRGRLPPPRRSSSPRRAGAPAQPCRAEGPRLGDRLVLERLGRIRGALDLPGRRHRCGEVRQGHRYDRRHRRLGWPASTGAWTGQQAGSPGNGFTGCATETRLRRCSVRGEPVRTHERLHAIECSPR